MTADDRNVSLTIPARGEYVVLARLALTAICRLTTLRPEDVADIKLAVTEAAGGLVGTDPAERMRFDYRLDDERLVLDITGPGSELDADELELARAIVAATVDEHDYDTGRVRLIKHLQPAD